MDIWKLLEIRKPIWLRIYDYIGQSKFVSCIEYYTSKLKWNKHIASTIYQTLSKEIKTYGDILIDNTTEIAYVNCGNIYVNENYLNNKSCGVKRFTMHHEGIHIKNNDSFMQPLIAVNMHLVAIAFIHYTMDINDIVYIFIVNLISIFTSIAWCNYGWHKNLETRADIDASQQVQCYQCVQEWSDTIYRDDIKDGYLGRKQLNKVINYYKLNNTLCCYHKH